MNEELWEEMGRLSRRMARIEIALSERIIALEAEVRALKVAVQPISPDWPAECPDDPVVADEAWLDQNITDWRGSGVANKVVERIMGE